MSSRKKGGKLSKLTREDRIQRRARNERRKRPRFTFITHEGSRVRVAVLPKREEAADA